MLGFVMRDELQIARWRDGSDVVPTFPAALPPRGGGRATKKVPHGSRSSRASARVANEFVGSEVKTALGGLRSAANALSQNDRFRPSILINTWLQPGAR